MNGGNPTLMVCDRASLPNSEASGSHAGSLKKAMARAETGKCSSSGFFYPHRASGYQHATVPTQPYENSRSLV